MEALFVKPLKGFFFLYCYHSMYMMNVGIASGYNLENSPCAKGLAVKDPVDEYVYLNVGSLAMYSS